MPSTQAATAQTAVPAAPSSIAPPAVVAGTPPAPNTLLDGTAIKLRLSETLSSSNAKVGQQIPFEVTEDVQVQGVTVLPKGAQALASVTEANAKKSMGRAGTHGIVVKKTGYDDWTRSMTAASGIARLSAEMVAK